MSEQNEIESIIETAQKAVSVDDRISYEEGVPVSVGKVQVNADLQRAIELRLPRPRRRTGLTVLTELSSFIDHVVRFRESATVVYADSTGPEFIAVYNENEKGPVHEKSGWRDFRAVYRCPMSPEWKAWRRHAEKEMTQEQFAEWLDERMDDLAEADGMPKPIEMLEMARNLQIFTKGTFEKKMDPETGSSSMVCKEEQTADSTKIHRAFTCALRVFDGGDLYSVQMRVKFKLLEGRPRFSYSIHRDNELVADAFMEMRTKIEVETERPVYAGIA